MAPKSKSQASKRSTKQATRTGPQHARRQPPTSSSSPPTVHAPPSNQIRPSPLYHGNPTIQSLLIDDYAINRYEAFKNKPFVPIYRLTSSFFESLHITKLHDLLSSQPMTTFLLNNHEIVFLGMVGQFFTNLKFENTNARHAIVSRVNKVPIRLDWQLLNTIFGTTLTDPDSTLYYWDDTHLWPETSDKFKIAELRTMFKVSSREAKDFNPSNLDPVDRVIYHIFVNFINPVAGHFTNPGKVPLVYYYLFTHQIPIDWGFVVFHRIADTITDHRRNLPHAPFLAPIFRHFQVPFTETGIPPPAFDMGTLTKKGIRLYNGQWITRQEYNSRAKPSSSSPPRSIPSSSSQPTHPSLLEGLHLLQKSVTELMNHVRYLEYGLTMVMPPDVRAEFESDKILFDIHSASDRDVSASEHTESEDTEGDASTSDASSSAATEGDASDYDAPLSRSLKKSKTQP